jgi:hypothetical protein
MIMDIQQLLSGYKFNLPQTPAFQSPYSTGGSAAPSLPMSQTAPKVRTLPPAKPPINMNALGNQAVQLAEGAAGPAKADTLLSATKGTSMANRLGEYASAIPTALLDFIKASAAGVGAHPIVTGAAGLGGMLYSPNVGTGSDIQPKDYMPPLGSSGASVVPDNEWRKATLPIPTPSQGTSLASNAPSNGLPLPPNWQPGQPTTVQHDLPLTPTESGSSQSDQTGTNQPKTGNWIEANGKRTYFTPETIASLANRNVVQGTPAAQPAMAGGPQGFDLGQLFRMMTNAGPGSANETFAERGQRKRNALLANHLLGQALGEQGANWRAMLGEQGANQRQGDQQMMQLLSALMGKKPVEKEFKTYSTKSSDEFGRPVESQIPGVFDPTTGQWTPYNLAGNPQQQTIGLHPAVGQPYEANPGYWDRFAKDNGFKDGKEAHAYAMDQQKKLQQGA